MTYATKTRIKTTKERFEQCQNLDARLFAAADAKTKEMNTHFSDTEFAKYENAYDAVLDYFYSSTRGLFVPRFRQCESSN